MGAILVIDVSKHQGKIDWTKVKASKVQGAIIRCGYGDDISSQDDPQWKRNADECTRLGIPFGTYLYSYAKTLKQAESEARHALRLIKGYKLSYPVYLDLEQAGTDSGAAERAERFGDLIEAAGYWCGVYANKSWWDNYLKGLTRFTKWAARYNDTLGMEADMWQYTSSGSVDGISGNVDMNYCYRDFAAEIGKSASSGEGDSSDGNTGSGGSTASVSGTTLELVCRTMKGEFGEGSARKSGLGNRYSEVQEMINHISSAAASVLAEEVRAGKYGNGDTRKTVLGARYTEVQKIVNGSTSGAKTYYTVKTGDTLSEIAVRYGTTTAQLKSWNSIKDEDKIYAGEKIRVK